MEKSVIIKPFENCRLYITGFYNSAEPENNVKSSFEIESVENLEKDIFELLLQATKKDFIEELENLCIKEIEENEN